MSDEELKAADRPIKELMVMARRGKVTSAQFWVEHASFKEYFKPLQPTWSFEDDGMGGFRHQPTDWAWIGWLERVRAMQEPRTDHIRSVPGGAAFLRVAAATHPKEDKNEAT